MMQGCYNCGGGIATVARYCRHCGAPQRRAVAADADHSAVSPQAPTIPLADESRVTTRLNARATDATHLATPVDAPLAANAANASPAFAPAPIITTPSAMTPATFSAPSRRRKLSPESRALRVWFGAGLAGGLLLLLCAVSLAVWLTARSYRRVPLAATEVARNAPATTGAERASAAPMNNTASDVATAAASPDADLSATLHQANLVTAKSPEIARQSARATKRAASMMEAAKGTQRADSTTVRQAALTKRATNAAAASAALYRRGLDWWPTNRRAAASEFRAAASNGDHPDAYYRRGLSLAEGRDPRVLDRSTLLAALEYFQRARPGGYAKQARRYEDRLGKEYDRRRNVGR